MTSAGNDFTLCRTGRGLAASRHPFGDARFPVRHSAARAEVPPCHQATHPRNEVSTLSGDLTLSFYAFLDVSLYPRFDFFTLRLGLAKYLRVKMLRNHYHVV